LDVGISAYDQIRTNLTVRVNLRGVVVEGPRPSIAPENGAENLVLGEEVL